MRVYLDTAVILQGAFSRRSHVTDLLALGDVQLVSSSYTLDVEVGNQILEHAEDETAELGAKALVATFLTELAIDVVPIRTGLEGDAHHAAAAADLHCDWICTYNLKDFTESQVPPSTPPARTPRGLLRALEPRRQLVEFPHLGESGTLLVMARHNETGVYLGEILESDNGTLVYTDSEGVVVVRSPDGNETSARDRCPHLATHTSSRSDIRPMGPSTVPSGLAKRPRSFQMA